MLAALPALNRLPWIQVVQGLAAAGAGAATGLAIIFDAFFLRSIQRFRRRRFSRILSCCPIVAVTL